MRNPSRVITGFRRPNLAFEVRKVSGRAEKLRRIRALCNDALQAGGSAVIYAATRKNVELVAGELAARGGDIPKSLVGYYHAGLSDEDRTEVQEAFLTGKKQVLVATNAFGMGIDRADVRQVIHYSLPGSLEAYYQEAGRAGRDGQSAKATLLYDPQDRALHEFFIQQSELTVGDLHTIHNAIRSGESWVTLDDIARVTGLHPVQLKVGASELERSGALEHLGDEGIRMLFRKGVWNPKEIDKTTAHSKEHSRHRQKQLDGIVNYAESNSCRRKIILNHFGDAGEAEAADCCDNCRSAEADPMASISVGQMNHGELAALVILDCIHGVQIKVGREKLAQILHGSKAQDILKFHHDKNVYYGRLDAVKQSDIKMMTGQLLEKGYIKVIGGEYPILSLTLRGENAIKQKETIPLKLPKSLGATEIRRAKSKLEAGGTVEYTAKLFADGLKPEQIARERGFTIQTIYDHFAQLIERGRISVEQVVADDIRAKVEKAIHKVGSTQYLLPIKSLLPDEISFELIRCVIAAYGPQTSEGPEVSSLSRISVERIVELGESKSPDAVPELIHALENENGNIRRLAASALGKLRGARAVEPLLNLLKHESKPQVRQYAVKALGAIGDKRAEKLLQQIATNEDEMYYTRDSANVALKQLHRRSIPSTATAPSSNYTSRNTDHASPNSKPDKIDSFLTKSHPRPLTGSWQTGWALGFHSHISGSDWSRSGVGELTYRLKYESDTTVLPALIQQTLDLFQSHPELGQADVLIPVPSSRERKVDPVRSYCDALAGKMGLQVLSVVAKTRQTQPQKGMKTLAQKRANVAGAFSICGEVKGKRILLVDDLFDSGATLEEITRLLLNHCAKQVNVLTLTRTIHSDA